MARLVDKKTDLEHDAACLFVRGHLLRDPAYSEVELETPLAGGFADVTAVRVITTFMNDPKHPFAHVTNRVVEIWEVKTERDEQSPGGWVRQLKRYASAIQADSCLVLVPTFELSDVQHAFLRACDVKVVTMQDLRNTRYPCDD